MQHDPSLAAGSLRAALAPFRGLWRGIEDDLLRLGVSQLANLRGRNAEALATEYCQQTRRPFDPVLQCYFTALIDFAETGVATPWWRYLREQESRALAAWPAVPEGPDGAASPRV